MSHNWSKTELLGALRTVHVKATDVVVGDIVADYGWQVARITQEVSRGRTYTGLYDEDENGQLIPATQTVEIVLRAALRPITPRAPVAPKPKKSKKLRA